MEFNISVGDITKQSNLNPHGIIPTPQTFHKKHTQDQIYSPSHVTFIEVGKGQMLPQSSVMYT